MKLTDVENSPCLEKLKKWYEVSAHSHIFIYWCNLFSWWSFVQILVWAAVLIWVLHLVLFYRIKPISIFYIWEILILIWWFTFLMLHDNCLVKCLTKISFDMIVIYVLLTQLFISFFGFRFSSIVFSYRCTFLCF